MKVMALKISLIVGTIVLSVVCTIAITVFVPDYQDKVKSVISSSKNEEEVKPDKEEIDDSPIKILYSRSWGSQRSEPYRVTGMANVAYTHSTLVSVYYVIQNTSDKWVGDIKIEISVNDGETKFWRKITPSSLYPGEIRGSADNFIRIGRHVNIISHNVEVEDYSFIENFSFHVR